jgi:hypothetical protein
MFILVRLLFHLICSIGRFFRKIWYSIAGRRQEEGLVDTAHTEPVTLEAIRIINDMENDSYRPYQSLSNASKVIRSFVVVIVC